MPVGVYISQTKGVAFRCFIGDTVYGRRMAINRLSSESMCNLCRLFLLSKEDLSWLTIPSLILPYIYWPEEYCFFSANELYLWIEIFFESIFVSIFAMVTLTVFQSVSKLKEGGILTVEEITSFGLIIMGIIIGVGELSFLVIVCKVF